jgi:hypothetical protein
MPMMIGGPMRTKTKATIGLRIVFSMFVVSKRPNKTAGIDSSK